ncbi:YgcG family protein [Rugamonas sp. FT82W]|uniref:YgcG family protein n=1 Tax=Duganella vulcania TaxID=2692166 RepID=A0A845FWZ0_9BURK|nr:TPM domain-containing protein [Duganella vulcania]MYM87033.1 YgcG family protein [Duganella vulcania]
MIFSWLRWMFAALLCALGGLACAQDALVKVPPLSSPVTDLTATLSADQRGSLEADLRAFEQRKGSQVAVLIVPTTKPESIEEYSIRVAEQWKIGRKKIDDGAILVVAKDDHALRIEVGYGLEGALNDATAKRIIDDIIVPRFRQNDFYGGIAAGAASIMKVIDGEALPAAQWERRSDEVPGLRQLLPVALIAALALGGVLRAVLGRVPGAVAAGGIIGLAAWLLAGAAVIGLIAGVLGFLFTLAGGSRLAGLYLASGRGHGRGGWGGGGGGFGGGGASGRW